MHNSKMPLTKNELFRVLCHISEQFHTSIAIIHIENDHFHFAHCNQAFTKLTGFASDELIGKSIRLMSSGQTNNEMDEELLLLLCRRAPFEINTIHYQKDGTAFWNHLTFQPIKDVNGNASYALLHCKDITEQMLGKMLSKLEHEVYMELEANGELQSTLQLITEKVEKYYIRNVYCAIHVVNEKRHLEAVASGSLPLQAVKRLNHLEISLTSGYNENAIYINDLSLTNRYSSKVIPQYKLTSCWSKPIYTNEKKLLGYITIYIKDKLALRNADIDFLKKLSPIIALSMKYVEQKQELKQLAFFDKATGLPNYHSFQMNLGKWVEEKESGAILLIHPREYSSVVDLYGRKFGDKLIQQIAHRILTLEDLKEEIIYGRFSNSFIIGVKKQGKQLENLVSKILQVTAFPFTLAERDIFITLQAGISYFDCSLTVDESIRRADTALTSTKFKNSTISYFNKETDERIQRELTVLNQLRFGIKNKEFTVNLQPKINLESRKVEGFEALARWNSPELGSVSPAEFIPIAEKSGRITEIDHATLKTVCHFQSTRLKNGKMVLPIAVNISAVHFYSESFVPDFLSLVKKYDIPPYLIKIEVTESMELIDLKKAKRTLSELRKLGYESSIDDFGVGFSSLSYLQQLPFSEIKIDRSFIKNICHADMHAVVQTIVQLGENLRMEVVAEGIETFEQYSVLRNLGCKAGQGFYFYKPLLLKEAELLLDSIQEEEFSSS